MGLTPEELEHISAENQSAENKENYTPRPKKQLVLAWILIAVVLFGFFGMCYWMVFYGRV